MTARLVLIALRQVLRLLLLSCRSLSFEGSRPAGPAPGTCRPPSPGPPPENETPRAIRAHRPPVLRPAFERRLRHHRRSLDDHWSVTPWGALRSLLDVGICGVPAVPTPRRLPGGTLQVQMWCAALLKSPPRGQFGPSHGHYLDFLWSGRRDSNPRPSPWQRKSYRGAPTPLPAPLQIDAACSAFSTDHSKPLLTITVNGAWYFRGARATESRTTCTTVRRYQGFLNTS